MNEPWNDPWDDLQRSWADLKRAVWNDRRSLFRWVAGWWLLFAVGWLVWEAWQ
jgi:hypothetical protein